MAHDSKSKKNVKKNKILQIVEQRREAKEKGERESYTSLECRVSRIARRDKKAFLNELCKEIEENSRMGKTRDLFKKMRYQANISRKDGHNNRQKW